MTPSPPPACGLSRARDGNCRTLGSCIKLEAFQVSTCPVCATMGRHSTVTRHVASDHPRLPPPRRTARARGGSSPGDRISQAAHWDPCAPRSAARVSWAEATDRDDSNRGRLVVQPRHRAQTQLLIPLQMGGLRRLRGHRDGPDQALAGKGLLPPPSGRSQAPSLAMPAPFSSMWQWSLGSRSCSGSL